MAKLISVIIVKDTEPVNAVCLSDDNANNWLSSYDGTTVVPDPDDELGTDFITITGCIAVNVTGMEPMPGVNSGWSYVDGEWIAPVPRIETPTEA